MRGRRYIWAALWVGAVSVVGGCHHSTTCPQPSLNDEPLVGAIMYACGDTPDTNAVDPEPLLVDVHLPGLGSSWLPLSAATLDAIEGLGATIVYPFQFPATRVRATLNVIVRIQSLSSGSFVVTIPRADRQDWRFLVGMRGAFTSEDSLSILRLGGRITHVFRWMPVTPDEAIADLPDASLPCVRRLPNVRYAEPDNILCLASAARATSQVEPVSRSAASARLARATALLSRRSTCALTDLSDPRQALY